jgi:hypothetical protein
MVILPFHGPLRDRNYSISHLLLPLKQKKEGTFENSFQVKNRPNELLI